MQQLSQSYENFYNMPCISGNHVPDGFARGRAHEVALSMIPDLKGWRGFLCGHPKMIQQMKQQVFLKGASMAEICSDAFLVSSAWEMADLIRILSYFRQSAGSNLEKSLQNIVFHVHKSAKRLSKSSSIIAS